MHGARFCVILSVVLCGATIGSAEADPTPVQAAAEQISTVFTGSRRCGVLQPNYDGLARIVIEAERTEGTSARAEIERLVTRRVSDLAHVFDAVDPALVCRKLYREFGPWGEVEPGLVMGPKAPPGAWEDSGGNYARFDYPSDVFAQTASPPGSRRDAFYLRSFDGEAVLVLQVMFLFEDPATRQTPREALLKVLQADDMRKLDRIQYAPLRNDWFVVSGTEGENDVYIRATVGCNGDIGARLFLTHPTRQRALYQPYIGRISQSLRLTCTAP